MLTNFKKKLWKEGGGGVFMRGKKPREWQGFDRISKCIFFFKNTIKACVQFFLAIVSVLVKHITHLRDLLNRLIFECRGQIKKQQQTA